MITDKTAAPLRQSKSMNNLKIEIDIIVLYEYLLSARGNGYELV